jgi:hypothetical protein
VLPEKALVCADELRRVAWLREKPGLRCGGGKKNLGGRKKVLKA